MSNEGREAYGARNRQLLERIGPLIEDFEATVNRDGKEERIKLYDPSTVIHRLSAHPDYVVERTLGTLNDEVLSGDPNKANYSKIVLDKWGRKDPVTKRYSETPEMVFYRAALSVAEGLVKNDPSLDFEQTTRNIFEKFFNKEIYPNTPYMANGGHKRISRKIEEALTSYGGQIPKTITNDLEQERKIKEQLFACFVLPLYDSRESIFKTLIDAANIQASVGGTGFNYELRPANEIVHGTGGTTDGPVSFMRMFSEVLGRTMNQGGKREGANMFMLDWNHPDIMRFIYSKRQDGEISAANISIAVDHEFIEAAKSDGDKKFYRLKNVHHHPELRPHISPFYTADQLKQSIEVTKINRKAVASLLLGENGVDVLSPWLPEGLDEEYKVIGKIGEDGYVYLDAKKVIRHLAFGAWFNGEPGVIFTGHINDHNPTHPRHYEEYLLEQKDQEAQSIVNTLRSRNPNASLEDLVHKYVWEMGEDGRLKNLPVGVGVIRATNPCGEKPLLPHEACVLGHVNLEKILVTDSVSQSGYRVDYDKFAADTRLMYEILDNAIDQNEFTTPEIEVTQKSNRKVGLGFMGLANMLYRLEIPYNSEEGRKFVDELLTFWERESDKSSFEKADKFGAFPNFKYSHHKNGRQKRNAIVRTLAPTGTTGFVAQTTGGMEPEYALAYTRTTMQGTSIDMFNPVLEEKLDKYSFFFGADTRESLHEFIMGNKGISTTGGSLQEFNITRQKGESVDSFRARQQNLNKIKKIFVTAYDILPEDHLTMEAIVQRHVDDAISKTTNFRHNASVEEVEGAFLLAHELGIKGVTFYRDGTRKDQPLKVKGQKYSNETSNGNLADLVLTYINRPRPEIVSGPEIKIRTPYDYNAFVRVGWERNEQGKPISTYEAFVNLGKTGEDLPAIAEGYGRLISLALKAGVPAHIVSNELVGIGGATQKGFGEERVMSLPDAIGQAIDKAIEQESRLSGMYNGNEKKDVTKSGNLCPKCSLPLRMIEQCEQCVCGYSKCN